VGALVLVALFALPSHASPSQAYYTAAQAAAGGKLYAARCASCHGAHLEGLQAPPLAGAGKPGGQSISDIYGFMIAQMPADAPGSLKPTLYVSILAFLLKKNGHPAGAAPLTPARASKLDDML
jgi:mono/diheme cytochrome c family protein